MLSNARLIVPLCHSGNVSKKVCPRPETEDWVIDAKPQQMGSFCCGTTSQSSLHSAEGLPDHLHKLRSQFSGSTWHKCERSSKDCWFCLAFNLLWHAMHLTSPGNTMHCWYSCSNAGEDYKSEERLSTVSGSLALEWEHRHPWLSVPDFRSKEFRENWECPLCHITADTHPTTFDERLFWVWWRQAASLQPLIQKRNAFTLLSNVCHFSWSSGALLAPWLSF